MAVAEAVAVAAFGAAHRVDVPGTAVRFRHFAVAQVGQQATSQTRPGHARLQHLIAPAVAVPEAAATCNVLVSSGSAERTPHHVCSCGHPRRDRGTRTAASRTGHGGSSTRPARAHAATHGATAERESVLRA
eukprot:SAG31_NODE_1967_length_6785_cov_7.007329_2_plen_132_part_00